MFESTTAYHPLYTKGQGNEFGCTAKGVTLSHIDGLFRQTVNLSTPEDRQALLTGTPTDQVEAINRAEQMVEFWCGSELLGFVAMNASHAAAPEDHEAYMGVEHIALVIRKDAYEAGLSEDMESEVTHKINDTLAQYLSKNEIEKATLIYFTGYGARPAEEKQFLEVIVGNLLDLNNDETVKSGPDKELLINTDVDV